MATHAPILKLSVSYMLRLTNFTEIRQKERFINKIKEFNIDPKDVKKHMELVKKMQSDTGGLKREGLPGK